MRSKITQNRYFVARICIANFKKRIHKMGFFDLDDDEKVRIRKCILETKGKKKYQKFNYYINRIMPRDTRQFSFRIASSKDYKHGFTENNRHLKNCYNHNNRIANFTKDFINSLESNYQTTESNEYKSYTDISNKTTNKNSNTDLAREIKITQQKINRVIKKIETLEKKSNGNTENLSKKELKSLSNAREKHSKLLQELQELQAKKKKRIRKNSTTFKEIVLNIDKHHTIKDIEIAYKKVQEAIPKLQEANFINVAIHRDEGHFNKITDEPIVNYHAHLLLNNLDKNNKTIFRQLTRAELSKIQDIMAESLQMERGARNSNNKHKTKWQLEHEKNKHIHKIRELLPQVENELKKDKEKGINYYNLFYNTVYKTNDDKEANKKIDDYLQDFVKSCYEKKIINDTKLKNYEIVTTNPNIANISAFKDDKEIKEFANNVEKYFNDFVEHNKALQDFIMELARKYLQVEKEKQAKQEKANMSLEQKQQQSIMQPELEAEHYINKLFGEFEKIATNQSLTTEAQLKKAKAIYTNIYNYSKKLKDTDPTTYEKVSKNLYCGDPIQESLSFLEELEKTKNKSIER